MRLPLWPPESIEQRLDSIERKRTHLLEVISSLDAAVVTARGETDSWSVQEIVEHLVLVEPVVFGNLDELGQRLPRPAERKHRIAFLAVMFILRFDIPVRIPSESMRPTGALTMPQLRAEWESNHARLRAWIGSTSKVTLAQPLFAHPAAGPLTMHQALRMLEIHLDRHTRQIVKRTGIRTSESAHW